MLPGVRSLISALNQYTDFYETLYVCWGIPQRRTGNNNMADARTCEARTTLTPLTLG